MLSLTGRHITKEFGAPSVRDIAVQSMRMVRFGGAYERHFWPIGMHMLLVADLVAAAEHPELEVHALLHDAPELGGCGDVCRPMKTQSARTVEDGLLIRIYEEQGLPLLSEQQHTLVKVADIRAANAEGFLGCGGRGYPETQTGFKRDLVAEGLLNNYLARVKSPLEYLDADGPWARRFEQRLRRAIRATRQGGHDMCGPA